MAASPKYDFLSGKGPANTNPWHPSYAISTFLLQVVRRCKKQESNYFMRPEETAEMQTRVNRMHLAAETLPGLARG